MLFEKEIDSFLLRNDSELLVLDGIFASAISGCIYIFFSKELLACSNMDLSK